MEIQEIISSKMSKVEKIDALIRHGFCSSGDDYVWLEVDNGQITLRIDEDGSVRGDHHGAFDDEDVEDLKMEVAAKVERFARLTGALSAGMPTMKAGDIYKSLNAINVLLGEIKAGVHAANATIDGTEENPLDHIFGGDNQWIGRLRVAGGHIYFRDLFPEDLSSTGYTSTATFVPYSRIPVF